MSYQDEGRNSQQRNQRDNRDEPGRLVLSRKDGERIRLRIPQDDGSQQIVWITVFDFYHNKCRVAVQAESKVEVMREELLHRT